VLDTNKYNNVSFIGGEFLQGQLRNPEVKKLFMEVVTLTASMLKSRKIDSVWFSATLIKKDQPDLDDVLTIFNECEPDSKDTSTGFWLCTSWDAVGRFRGNQQAQWESNMSYVHQTYKNIKLNCCVILQGKLVEDYNNDKFRFSYFNQWNCTIFCKVPSPGAVSATNPSNNEEAKRTVEKMVPGLFAKRRDFIEFIKKLDTEEHWVVDRLYNIMYRSDELIRTFNDGHLVENARDKNFISENHEDPTAECGHLLLYSCYLDSEECAMCDKKSVLNL
jgi:hypothetical protein